jgi:hypothetical protein
MQELTEDAVCHNFAKSKIKTAAEGIPANERNVNRSTRQKISGREQRPGVVAGRMSVEATPRKVYACRCFEEFS